MWLNTGMFSRGAPMAFFRTNPSTGYLSGLADTEPLMRSLCTDCCSVSRFVYCRLIVVNSLRSFGDEPRDVLFVSTRASNTPDLRKCVRVGLGSRTSTGAFVIFSSWKNVVLTTRDRGQALVPTNGNSSTTVIPPANSPIGPPVFSNILAKDMAISTTRRSI